MCDIFISYNWGVSDDVDRFYEQLVNSNYTVWRDIRDLNQTNEPLTLQIGFSLSF